MPCQCQARAPNASCSASSRPWQRPRLIRYRLELLEQLAQGERSVEVLADRLKLSIANASQHLQHMRRGGLVAARRDGKFVFYRLADDAVLDLVASLRRVAETQSAEVERVVRSYFDKSRCARARLARRADEPAAGRTS